MAAAVWNGFLSPYSPVLQDAYGSNRSIEITSNEEVNESTIYLFIF